MKTSTEEISAELAALESHVTVLETQMRTRGLTVPPRPDVANAKLPGATLDEVFTAMGVMESHAAKLRLNTRLAAPLKYAPNSATVMATAPTARLTPMQQIQAAGGVKAIKAAKLADEIACLEASLGKYEASTVTHRSIQSRIKSLRAQHMELTLGK